MNKQVKQKDEKSFFNKFMLFLYLISFAFLIYFFLDGFDFYFSSLTERAHHDVYRLLRPAGLRGHSFGVIGSAMMLLMLLYSIRKRTRLFKNFLPLSYWLKIHIYFGIIGPLLIILHTSFKVQGLVAVSFWAMIAVALSGVLGRYLYLQIPHGISGSELSLQELQTKQNYLKQQLEQEYGIKKEQLSSLESYYLGESVQSKNILVVLMSLMVKDIFRFGRSRHLRKQLAGEVPLPASTLKKMFKLIKQEALLYRRIRLLDSVQQLFYYWHIIHKPFAIIMYIVMFVHVGIAIFVGYTWIF